MKTVKGYKTHQGHLEVLYALHENGMITTCTRNYSSSFNQKGDTWKETNEIPTQAEFIGKYKI